MRGAELTYVLAPAEPEVEPEEDEDIFELEGQAEQAQATQPGVASEAVEQARGQGARCGFEGTVARCRDGGANASTSGHSAVRHAHLTDWLLSGEIIWQSAHSPGWVPTQLAVTGLCSHSCSLSHSFWIWARRADMAQVDSYEHQGALRVLADLHSD